MYVYPRKGIEKAQEGYQQPEKNRRAATEAATSAEPKPIASNRYSFLMKRIMLARFTFMKSCATSPRSRKYKKPIAAETMNPKAKITSASTRFSLIILRFQVSTDRRTIVRRRLSCHLAAIAASCRLALSLGRKCPNL